MYYTCVLDDTDREFGMVLHSEVVYFHLYVMNGNGH